MNQAALLQIWCQSINSSATDSSTTDSSTTNGAIENSSNSTRWQIDNSTVQSGIQQAALQLQAHLMQEEGALYPIEDLQQVLMRWLESSIECLVEDALFHTLEGDRAFAFNRRAFERQMQHLQPVPQPVAAPTIAA